MEAVSWLQVISLNLAPSPRYTEAISRPVSTLYKCRVLSSLSTMSAGRCWFPSSGVEASPTKGEIQISWSMDSPHVIVDLFRIALKIMSAWVTHLIQPLGPHGERVKLLGEVVDGEAVVGFGGVVSEVDLAVDVDEGALADDGRFGGRRGRRREELSVCGERKASEDAVREAFHVAADGTVAEAALPLGEDAGRARRRAERGHDLLNQ